MLLLCTNKPDSSCQAWDNNCFNALNRLKQVCWTWAKDIWLPMGLNTATFNRENLQERKLVPAVDFRAGATLASASRKPSTLSVVELHCGKCGVTRDVIKWNTWTRSKGRRLWGCHGHRIPGLLGTILTNRSVYIRLLTRGTLHQDDSWNHEHDLKTYRNFLREFEAQHAWDFWED